MDERYGFKPEFVNPPTTADPNFLPLSTGTTYPPLFNPLLPQPSNNINNYTTPTSPPSSRQAYQWLDFNIAYGSAPPSAVQGGVDVDGHPIYVGRAYHQGDLIPAKVIPSKNAAYVPYGEEEHSVEQVQILCRQTLQWVHTQGGSVPPGAVPGGQTSAGEPLYVGRVFHEGAQTVGKVQPSHGSCYIPFGGRELAFQEYEVLVLRP